MGKKLSIVICTYSRAPLLEKTLHSLLDLDDIHLAEVIVVDNNSTDNTQQIVHSFIKNRKDASSFRYILEQKQGLSVARNTGVKASRSEIIAFLDDDAIPVKGWVTSILQTFHTYSEAYAIGGIIRPNFESERPDWLIKPFELPYTIVDLGNEMMLYPPKLYPFGANMAFRKSVFDKYLFPEELGRKGASLISGEESWLFGQFKKEKWQVYYVPSMAVFHFIPKERLKKEWITKRYYYQGVSYSYTSKTFAEKAKLIAITCVKLVYNWMSSLVSWSEGDKLLNRCRQESIRGTFVTLTTKSEG
ncbi:glycosyltransferase involved in cell wall biosynthesis [Paenibacillus sp. V4I9]|uniref:glycosyltransferase n=1 Tax=Paenibacillus sp. V4I9 TaxID=3042308 RepID=UPI00278127AB|nr:glycosyltransferase [Paenibacillus sp. V4I9]MDQ0890874.1 glycosyltransferase involved in cell wall biosynthesis [Paenibacillus sp. V4I9]